MKPSIGFREKLVQPKVQGAKQNSRLAFGFSYFRQMELFGLAGASKTWFASFLVRLQTLSEKSWDDLVDPRNAQSFRFHQVDWGSTNCPIDREDLDWVPQDYLESEDSYPFYQFQVSTALGRFAGFRDESGVFQIVLVDPLHNLQPAKIHNYTVRPSGPLASDYYILRAKIDTALQRSNCNDGRCETVSVLQQNVFDDVGVLLLKLDGTDLESANALIADGTCQSLYAVFQEGLLHLMNQDALERDI